MSTNGPLPCTGCHIPGCYGQCMVNMLAPPISRLEKAKAALEAALAADRSAYEAHDQTNAGVRRAEKEVAEAEAAAAAKPKPVPPPLPDALVEVAHALITRPQSHWHYSDVLVFLAKSHGLSVDALREAIK